MVLKVEEELDKLKIQQDELSRQIRVYVNLFK